MKAGIELIAEERQRQIEQEGWTPEHDDQHENGELALAAACYSMPETFRNTVVWLNQKLGELYKHLWPFGKDWWKPTPDNRIRELQKAGALIAAEIDRLQRKEGR